MSISSEEYDNATPMFMIETNAAMDERADLEHDAYEKAKKESESK